MAINNPTFSGCPFAISLPTVQLANSQIHISFMLLNSNLPQQPVVISACSIVDKFDVFFKSDPLYISKTTNFYKVNVAIPFKKEPYLNGATLRIVLLTQSGIRMTVKYFCASHIQPKFALSDINLDEMTTADKDTFIKTVSSAVSKPTSTPMPIPQAKPSNTILQEYKNALLAEAKFLKANGGHKYKVSNGRFLCKTSKGSYCYSFELDAELYLSDNAPLTVTTPQGLSTTGSVLICDGFEIILLLKSGIGAVVPAGWINVEPWKLLISLLDRIDKVFPGSIADQILSQGPSLLTGKPITEIRKGQDVAKSHALNNPITFIWGPPGTGKTHTMSEIAISLLKQQKTVLIVSHSNISVDGVAKKITEMLESAGEHHYLKSGSVLRYGYVRDVEFTNHPYAVSYNYTISKHPTMHKKLLSLQEKKASIIASGKKHSEDHIAVENELKSMRVAMKNQEAKYVKEASIVATTISKVCADSLFDLLSYDAVMFDEASMAYVPQIICAANYARERFICVGDFKQLAPIAQSPAKIVLGKDIFSYLGISATNGKPQDHQWLVMLNEQRRMHPKISAFVNTFIYNHLLTDHGSVHTIHRDVIARGPFQDSPANLLDLTGTYCATTKNSNNSRFNILSAILAFSSAVTAAHNGETNIGIITPYAAQSRLIQAMIRDYRNHSEMSASCSTVHQFQGSERNLIVFDAVESYPSTKPGWLMSKDDNGSISRLVNVAVTRTRGKLITVANRGYWEQKYKDTQHTFFQLIQYLMTKANVIGVKEQRLRTLLPQLQTGKDISVLVDVSAALARLKKDLGMAKHKVIVSIPDSEKFGETEDQILSMLMEAKARGVNVRIKAKDVSHLSKKWRENTVESSNAVFPLIDIDNRVMWYGLPMAQGKFVDGKAAYVVVLPIYARLSGNHTTDLICSMAELEYFEVNGITSQMLSKSTAGTNNAKVSLAEYVMLKKKCPKCKDSMLLAKGKSNKPYMRCPNCKGMEYLNKDFLNQYITESGAHCPQCKSGIVAYWGSYGTYIKCSKGHMVKLDTL